MHLSISLKKAPTAEQNEKICDAAENAARSAVLNKIPAKRLEDLNILVEASGSKPLRLKVDVSANLSAGDEDMKELVREATDAAFKAAEDKVMELGLCRKPKLSRA
jgi:hypothetical protein